MYVVNFKIETDAALELRDIQTVWDYLREETEGFPGVKVSYEAVQLKHVGFADSGNSIIVSH